MLLHALRTASANVKLTSLEPKLPTLVVIDPECVEKRPIGATAWSMVDGREYDEVEKDEVEKDDVEKDEAENEGRRFEADLMRLIAGRALDPDFLDRRHGDLPGKQEKEFVES